MTFTEIDVVVACLHPKIICSARYAYDFLEYRFRDNEILSRVLKLVNTLYDRVVSDEGLTQVAFDAEVLKFGFQSATNSVISASYSKCLGYTEDELHSIKTSLSDIVSNEAINRARLENSESPTDFLRSLQKINVDNITEVDAHYIHEVGFGEVDIDALENRVNGHILKSSIDFINKCNPLGGYLDKTLTMVVGKSGSGKSLFLTQEAAAFCMQGKKVMYVALGDMEEYHFVSRLSAQLLHLPLSETSKSIRYWYNRTLENFPQIKNLKMSLAQPGKVSCEQWVSRLKGMGYFDEYDVFIVDYDTNFASDEEMYEKGESTYNAVKGLVETEGKYAFIACQPKQCYWQSESIPMEAGGESSRKAHIVDNIITISTPPMPLGLNSAGYLNVAKNRNGMTGMVPYFRDKNGRFEIITPEQYTWIKTTDQELTLIGSGCEKLYDNLTDSMAKGGKNGK